MRPIAPKFAERPWVKEFVVAENQPEFKPLTAAFVLFEDGGVQAYTRWTFTAEERARIAAGEDIYVSFPNRVGPHSVELRPAWADSEVAT